MICEFCGEDKINVKEMEYSGLKFDSCTSCNREIDELGRFFSENFRKAVHEMMKFPNGVAKV